MPPRYERYADATFLMPPPSRADYAAGAEAALSCADDERRCRDAP